MRIFPVTIDNPEGDILVWRTSRETKKTGVFVSGLFDDPIRWRLRLVDEIRIKYVELARWSGLCQTCYEVFYSPCSLERPSVADCRYCRADDEHDSFADQPEMTYS